MSVVETRVAQVRFDNAKFEAGVQDTLKSLNQLDKELDNIQKNDGVEHFATAMRDGFSDASRSVRDFAQDFKQQKNIIVQSYTVIGRIINKLKDSIANTFIKMGRELTIAPVADGFHEYELKMDSIKTIMASTGEDLNTVKRALEELNRYADETIYSFSDMTQNIGKFTNAGIDLNRSVAAIKGVANWAAISGANANEASRAMYNLAQSLSAGYVKLIDWKSIENANMATVEFKNQLIATAVEMKLLTKVGDKYRTKQGHLFNATSNFNETLQDQWMTSDVLIGVLGQYADETTEIGKKATKAATEVRTFTKMMDTLKEASASGWAETFEHIWGDFNGAQKLFTGLSERLGGFIDNVGKFRNDVLSEWERMGGQLMIRQTLFQIVDDVKDVGNEIGGAFLEAFGINKDDPVNDLAFRLVNFTRKIRDGMKSFSEVLHGPSFVEGKTNLELIGDVLGKVLKFLLPVVGAFVGLKAAGGAVSMLRGFGSALMFLVRGPFKMAGSLLAFLPQGGLLIKMLGFLLPLLGGFLFMTSASAEGVDEESKATSKLSTTLKDLGKKYSDTKEKIKSWFNTITSDGRVKKALDELSTRFKTFKDNLLSGKYFTKAKNDLKAWFKGVKESPEVAKLFENLSGSYGRFKEYLSSDELKVKVGDWLNWIIERLDDLKQMLGSAKSWLGGKFSSVVEWVAKAINGGMGADGKFSFKSFINGLGFSYDFGPIFEWAASARDAILEALLSIFVSTAKAEDFDEAAETGNDSVVQSLTDKLTDSGSITEQAMAGLKDVWEKIKKAFSDIGESLSDEDLYGKLKTGIVRIGELVTLAAPTISTLMGLFFQFRIGSGLSGAAKGLKKTGKNLADAAKVMKTGLGGLLESFKNEGLSLFSVLKTGGTKVTDSISGYFDGMKEAAAKKDTFATAALKIAGALALLVGSLWVLSKIPAESIDRSLVTIGILAAGLVSITLILSKARSSGGKSMAMMAVGLLLLMIPIKMLAGMSMEEFTNGLTKIGILMLVVGGLANLMRTGEGGKMNSGGFIGIAIGLTLLLIPLNLLAKMDPRKLTIGLLAIGAIMLVLGLTMQLFRDFGGTKIRTGPLIGLAVGLLLLMAPLAILAGMSNDRLIRGVIGLGLVMAEIGILANMIRGIKIGSAVTLGIMAIALGLIIVPLMAIAFLDTERMARGVVGLGIVMLELGVLANITRGIKIRSAVTLALMAGALWIATIPLSAVAGMDTGKLLKGVIGLGAIVLEMVLLSKGIQNLNVKSVLLFGLLGLITWGIVEGLKPLADMEWGGIGKMLVVLLGLGVLMSGFAKLGDATVDWKALIANVLSVATVVTVIVAIMTTLDWLDQTYAGGQVFESLKGMAGRLGEVVGAFIGGIGAGASESLKTIGDNLKNFAETISGITPEQVGAADNIIDMMLKLAATEVLSAASGILTNFGGDNGNKSVAAKMVQFAAGMVLYSKIVKGVDTAAVTNSKAAADMLLQLAGDAPKEGGLLDFITGTTNWDSINTNLPKFATAMKEYAEALMGSETLSSDDINSVVSKSEGAAKILMSLYNQGNNIKSDSWLDKLTGSANWEAMGSNLTSFAGAMIGYAVSLTQNESLTPDQVSKAITDSQAAAKILMSLYAEGNQIRSGSWLDEFLGAANWSQMETDLPAFARAMVGYAKELTTGGFDASVVTASENAANTLIELQNKLPDSNGLWQKLFGEKSWNSVTSGLVEFGTALADFSTQGNNINKEGMQKGVDGADSLVTIAGKLRGDYGLLSVFVDNANLFTTFGTSLGTLATSLVDFSARTNTLDVSSFALVLGMLGDMVGASETLSEFGGASWLADEMATFISALDREDAMNLESGIGNLSGIAERIGAALSKGVDTGFNGKSLGMYIDAGLAEGINAYAFLPKAAILALALKMREIFKENLDINSPSGVFSDFGMFITMGLAEGLKDGTGIAGGAMDDLGDATIREAETMLGKLTTELAQGIDPTIRIRPVLDASQLGAQLGSMDGMLTPRSLPIGVRSRDLAMTLNSNPPASGSNRMLETLSERIDELGNAFANMDLVLDSGALVGGIRGQMDKSLGRTTLLKVRGL